MDQRLAAALIGATMGLATFAGSTIAVSAASPEEKQPPQLSQDQVSQVICEVLQRLNLIDRPELADLVRNLGCQRTTTTTTTTTTAETTTNPPGDR
ncbi:hypothetical protein ACIGNX_15980 [Actinosynnema sp. NPDC053489]|uniref:hypothetical protein n=1 Tax=Actinosynnema sp. NPDC053489 TaxID=3363916 RepID=UPI0037C969EF